MIDPSHNNQVSAMPSRRLDVRARAWWRRRNPVALNSDGLGAAMGIGL